MACEWYQMQNYLRKKEQKERREKDLREGLQLYKYVLQFDFVFTEICNWSVFVFMSSEVQLHFRESETKVFSN